MPLIFRFLMPCARCANSLNNPSLHSLDSCVFNSWRGSNMSLVVGLRTSLVFSMSDMNFPFSADR